MQWIAGQGDNGAYGMRLKNVSGSSSVLVHHAWMMHSPLKGAKSLNRGMVIQLWVTWENVTNAHAAFEVAHNPHHGMPLTKDLWYYAYTG
ncbi:hypothetical protein ALC56_14207 [Trachymyrmex septentrionalis]|uniref:Uncharacterized protein n=1 Tax=Trachymyrmex septentrionalis TaxID=34720 RepID=A0A195ET41_9HYME|nr:hypothetical protein ALC56_14207 [Trachymyrmex septentrionalis]